jgi:hypothetical protein
MRQYRLEFFQFLTGIVCTCSTEVNSFRGSALDYLASPAITCSPVGPAACTFHLLDGQTEILSDLSQPFRILLCADVYGAGRAEEAANSRFPLIGSCNGFLMIVHLVPPPFLGTNNRLIHFWVKMGT